MTLHASGAQIGCWADAVVEAIRKAAFEGRPCPSVTRLTAELGLPSARSTALALDLAVQQGRIRQVRPPRGTRPRVLAAPDGSWSTAP